MNTAPDINVNLIFRQRCKTVKNIVPLFFGGKASWSMPLPKPQKLNAHYPIECHSTLDVLATNPAREKENKMEKRNSTACRIAEVQCRKGVLWTNPKRKWNEYILQWDTSSPWPHTYSRVEKSECTTWFYFLKCYQTLIHISSVILRVISMTYYHHDTWEITMLVFDNWWNNTSSC